MLLFFAYWVIFHAFLSSADPPSRKKCVSKNKKKTGNNFRGSSGLDPEEALHFVGPDQIGISFPYKECPLVIYTFLKTSFMKRINMHLSGPIYFLCFSDTVSEVCLFL